MTIYQSLMQQAAEWRKDGPHTQHFTEDYAAGKYSGRLQSADDLEYLAARICKDALTDFLKKHESHYMDIPVWDAIEHIRSQIIGGPK